MAIPKRILVERTDGVGDVLLTVPVLRGLKEKYPESHLSFLTWDLCSEVIRDSPYIDELITIPAFTTNRFHSELLRTRDFDLVIYLDYQFQNEQYHVIEMYCDQAGVTPSSKELDIVLHQEDHRFAEALLQRNQINRDTLLIGVHQGLSWPCRMWYAERFREALTFFTDHYRAKVVEFSRDKEVFMNIGVNLTGQASVKQTAAV